MANMLQISLETTFLYTKRRIYYSSRDKGLGILFLKFYSDRLYGPLSGHRHLLHFHWPLITDVIETPDEEFYSSAVSMKRIWKAFFMVTLHKHKW